MMKKVVDISSITDIKSVAGCDMNTSNKKKNTYIVSPSKISKYFQKCKQTPLTICVLNGARIQSSTGFTQMTEFPNPGAYYLAAEHRMLSPTMGKLSKTIIEYLDKDTGAPVVMLFPDTVYICDGYETDYMKHLNHASRRDFKYQMGLREKLVAQAMQKQK